MCIFVHTVYCLDKRDSQVLSFQIATAYYTIWQVRDSRCTSSVNQLTSLASYWVGEKPPMFPVLISLPNFRHVLIDRLICNLYANIVNRLH